MKLLKFVDGDAPQTSTDLVFDPDTCSVSFGANCPMKWVPDISTATTAADDLAGCYWLIDDNGVPLTALNDIILMRAIPTARGATPKGVTDKHLEGIDFRNKKGKAIESSRAEYGATYKKAAAKPTMMAQEENYIKRQDVKKREREAIAEQVLSGNAIDHHTAPRKKPNARKENNK
eukprot:Tbor_TRINITY_DN4505_c0_g2::TRINITY_DN4505_c0_g2_i1::g.15823::m.15823